MWRGCYKSGRQCMSMTIYYDPRGAKSLAILQVHVNCLFYILEFLRVTGTISSILLSAHSESSSQVWVARDIMRLHDLPDVAPRLRCLGCCILGASRKDNYPSTCIVFDGKHHRIKGTETLQAPSCAKIIVFAMQYKANSKLESSSFQCEPSPTNPAFNQ
jgi:hypothetical protein